MPINCQNIIDEYIKWIKDNTSLKTIEDDTTCVISTPFLNRNNDHLEIYVLKNNGDFVLTDDGLTIEDLKMSGVTLNSPKREKIFKTVLNGFGVKLGKKDDLFIEANLSNIGQKKHYLLQAILAVSDMYTLSQESVASLFKEDVERYFKSNEIVFNKDIKIGGKTGFDHNIDFLIPASKRKPERLIRTINTPKRDSVMATILVFNDIAEIREEKMLNYVIYNDTADKVISPDLISAFSNYGFKHIPWSQKERCNEELALI